MLLAKDAAHKAQNLALFAKVSRRDVISGENSGIPAGYVGVYLNEDRVSERNDFLSTCCHSINRGSTYVEVESLQHKETVVLIPDKYFSFDGKNCKEGEMLIKIPEKDGGIRLPGKITKHVMDTDMAMDEHRLSLYRSGVDVSFTPNSLRQKQYYRDDVCNNKEFGNTEEFVSYVQKHGPKKFTNCVFQDVDFEMAEIELKRRCDRVFVEKSERFQFSEMKFEQNGFMNCQSANCKYIQIDPAKNIVRNSEENKKSNSLVDDNVELVMDTVRKQSRDNSRGGR